MSPVINNWKTVNIGDLGQVITGGTPSSRYPELFGTDYPFITPTDIDNSCRHIETERFLSEQGRDDQSSRLLPPGAVCVVCIGATIGKICMTNKHSFTNQQINSIIVNKTNYDNSFVFYLLRTKNEVMKSIAGGAATPIVNKTAFSNIKVVVPPLPTQRKIAAILSAYEDLIENNQQRIKILEEIVQDIYTEWFVKFRFPGHEKVKFVDSSLGRIPEGWEIKRVKDIVIRLKAKKIYEQHDVMETGNIMVIDQSSNEFLGFHDDDADLIASSSFPIIIFGDHTCKMQLLVKPFSIGPNVVPFTAKDGQSTYYLFSLIHNLVETREYKRHWTELANKEVLYSHSIITQQFDNYVEPLFRQVNILRSQMLTLHRTRDLLLPKLISGEHDVSNLDIKTGDDE